MEKQNCENNLFEKYLKKLKYEKYKINIKKMFKCYT